MLEPKVENPIGIDLGTTNCCVAFIQNGHVQIIPNTKTDERTTPSYVFYTGKGVHVGKLAFNNVVLHPERVVYDAKRMIGRSFHDQNIQKNLPYWKFAVEEDPQTSKPLIRLPNDLILTPEDVSCSILRYLKSQAESFTGKPVRNAVITVPAYFNYNQRTATQKAAEEAGFKVLQIINEPTAAALAYVDANYRENGCEKTIVVYDLGGGTFDVSILRIKKDENGEEFRVLGTSGDTYLGGRDFDNNLIDLVLKKVQELGLRVDKILTRRIAAQVILKKIELTEAEHTDVLLPVIDNDDVEDVALRITREEFEQINMHLFKRSIDILDTSIRAANLTKEEVDEVVLVGGSSKIPKIQEMVRDFFKNAHVTESVSSSEAVAHGAALWAATFSEEDTKRLIIADVTPLSLGTEIARGRMNFFVKRNSLIPTEVKATYRTSVDNQTRAVFQIYEGERLLVKDNTRLGSFNIEFPPLPLYHPIDVVFRVNVNGILEVGAEVDSKIYSNVQIVYDPTDVAKAVDFAEEADFMRNLDAAAMKRVKRLDNFENYFIRISALCDRSKKFEAEEKDALLKVCCEQLVWSTAISDSEVTEEVDRKIVERRNEAEAVTEPILQKYGYKVKNVSRRHFTEFLQSLNETEVE